MTTIDVSGLEKRFGSTHAVGPISFKVEQGELLSLLGPSGCGKTTTLRMIAGFESPSAGRIYIGGRDATVLPVERRGVGMVFQSYALFPHLSVYDNVAFGLRLRRRSRSEIERRVVASLTLVGLQDYGERMPRQLSGGQQQRISLARALTVEPDALLLDEPLSNLDLKLREQMRDEIRSLQQRLGITAIYVTHDQGEAMAMSDRVAVMNRGCIEQIGAPREVYERPASLFVAGFIGRCSVLPGQIERPAAGLPRFATASGVHFDVAPEFVCDEWVAGHPLTLVLRPEGISFTAPEGVPFNRLPVEIEDFVYVGESTDYTLKLKPGGERLAASLRTLRGTHQPARGEHLDIFVRTSECVLVNELPQTGTS